MKKFIKTNKRKIVIASAMLSLATMGNAQWAVTNVNDPLYFGPTGVFTQMVGQMNNTVKASIDQVSALGDLTRKQSNQLQEDTDIRNRAAMGYQAMAQHNLQMMPTLEACAALTARGAGAAAVTSSMSGGSGGGGGKSRTLADTTKITSESVKQSEMLSTKATLGTCGVNDNGVAGCSGSPGEYGGNAKQLSADVSSLSIKANMKNSDRLDKNNQDFANFTLDSQGFDVAKQYIRNATFYNAPMALSNEQLQKNPSYKAAYDSVMTKLNGAYQAMLDIASTRKAGNPLPSGSLAGKFWTDNQGQYQSLFGMKQPTNPSLTDLLNFAVFYDYFGTPKATAMDQQAQLQDISNKLALNNLISYKQLTQQENTNILLALMLTQSVTPVSSNDVQNQFNKYSALQK